MIPNAPAQSTLIIRDPRSLRAALGWLALGILVYAVARPPTVLLAMPPTWNLASVTPFSRLLGSVPTLIHVVAFSLLSASIVGATVRRIIMLCAAWLAVELACEFSQHLVVRAWLLRHANLIDWLPYVRIYLARGTFDWGDVLAALLGAAFTAWTLTYHRGDRHA